MTDWTPSYGMMEEQREDMYGIYVRLAVVNVRALDEESPVVERVELQLAPDAEVPDLGAWYRLLPDEATNPTAPIVLSAGTREPERTIRVKLEAVSAIEARQLEARFQWV